MKRGWGSQRITTRQQNGIEHQRSRVNPLARVISHSCMPTATESREILKRQRSGLRERRNLVMPQHKGDSLSSMRRGRESHWITLWPTAGTPEPRLEDMKLPSGLWPCCRKG